MYDSVGSWLIIENSTIFWSYAKACCLLYSKKVGTSVSQNLDMFEKPNILGVAVIVSS